MPPTLYLVRHAEGLHNLKNSHHIRDAALTELGKKQCAHLSATFPAHGEIDLVMASPLKRAIETAVRSFGPDLGRQGKIVLVPDAQEISAKDCDVGFEEPELREQLREVLGEEVLRRIDFEFVDEGWCKKEGKYAAQLTAVKARAARLRSWLFSRPEKTIVLVTHGAFLHYMMEDWRAFDYERGTGFKNCDYRQFVFEEGSTVESAHLLEVGVGGKKEGKPDIVNINDIEMI